MTDDRARRIRNMRNRAGRNGGAEDDDEPTEDEQSAETESTDAGDDEAEAESVDDEQGTETESTDAEDDEAESIGDEDDEAESTDEDAEGETVSFDEDDIESPSGGDDSGTESDDESESATDDDSTDEETVETETKSEGEPAQHVEDELDVDIDPALRGAIAGTGGAAAVGGGEATVDASAVGEGGDGYADATIGRGKEVLQRGDSLIASAHNDEETIQMLEFYLMENRYAIEIDRISAIVEMKDITRFPRGPEAIDGVTDLRGEITGVLDPTAMLDIERSDLSEDHYIVVLERDDDKQKLGVRVTDVSQAVTHRKSQIDETATAMDDTSGSQHDFVEGVIKKTEDDETTLITWLNVDGIIESISMEHTPAEA